MDQWKFDDLKMEAYGTPAGAGGDTSTDGLLGNRVLEQFRVTFDYSRKRLIFEGGPEKRRMKNLEQTLNLDRNHLV